MNLKDFSRTNLARCTSPGRPRPPTRRLVCRGVDERRRWRNGRSLQQHPRSCCAIVTGRAATSRRMTYRSNRSSAKRRANSQTPSFT
jgi:hypothetical protein